MPTVRSTHPAKRKLFLCGPLPESQGSNLVLIVLYEPKFAQARSAGQPSPSSTVKSPLLNVFSTWHAAVCGISPDTRHAPSSSVHLRLALAFSYMRVSREGPGVVWESVELDRSSCSDFRTRSDQFPPKIRERCFSAGCGLEGVRRGRHPRMSTYSCLDMLHGGLLPLAKWRFLCSLWLSFRLQALPIPEPGST